MTCQNPSIPSSIATTTLSIQPMLLVILTFCQLLVLVTSAPVPFKDSVEIVFTPQDLKDIAEYTLWKIPEVKDNFKTTVKQKVLNRLLSKDVLDSNPNPDIYLGPMDDGVPSLILEPVERGGVEAGGGTEEEELLLTILNYANQISSNEFEIEVPPPRTKPLKAVLIDAKKSPGVFNSILRGPASGGIKRIKLVGLATDNGAANNDDVVEEEWDSNSDASDNDESDDNQDGDSDEEYNQVEYLVPSRIKNERGDYGVKYYRRKEKYQDPFET